MHINDSEKRNLLLIKIALILILLGLVIVGKRIRLWPIVTWSVYSTYEAEYPQAWIQENQNTSYKYQASVSSNQLRAITKNGEILTFFPGDLLPVDRDTINKKLVKNAFDDIYSHKEKARETLIDIIQKHYPDIKIKTIEKWKLDWKNIDILSSPPLDHRKPSQKTLVGTFEIR